MARKNDHPNVTVIGAGLAGVEAAFQLIRRGVRVKLVEMRPKVPTGAHSTDLLAELVCSNSVGSNLPDRASGLLKEELRALSSYILDVAYKYRVPAGNALAVDREAFAREITRYMTGHSHVEFVNDEAVEFPDEGIVILATGPLTSSKMLSWLSKTFGADKLAFFDAIAPVVASESVDMTCAFVANRYGDGEEQGDYINCPMNKAEYEEFVKQLLAAERTQLPEFEKEARRQFFSGCQPVEEIASTGPDSLRFGPMKPVGFNDPRTGRRPWAVVQLRQDNLLGSMFNIVGFQTNLKHGEQERVFRLIPALKNAVFTRLGQMHRNSYLFSPAFLTPTLQVKEHPDWFVAGQICGVEGYTESTGMGLLAGLNAARICLKKQPVVPPPQTMLGALVNYVTFKGHKPKDFAPMNANFGLLTGSAPIVKGETAEHRRAAAIVEARRAFKAFVTDL